MFENLKVLELATVLAGPGVGQFFAELGAKVIKVENVKTNGDVTRGWRISGEQPTSISAYFSSCNWGKKSIALDLSQPSGLDLINRLMKDADIVLANFKPGDAEKLGVSYQQFSTINPKIIYGEISGYGPDNDRVGYDAVIQAESGFMDLNGEKDGPPLKMPVALIDVLAGHQLKEGLLMALLKRERAGDGSLVEVSLLQTAIASLANQSANWLVANKLPVRKGSAHPNIAPYGEVFQTKDNKQILLAIGSDRQFEDFIELIGPEDFVRTLFQTNQLRVENRDHLNKIIARKIAVRDSNELLPLLHRQKIPAGLIQNLQEVFQMEEAKRMLIHGAGITGVRTFAVHFSDVTSIKLLPPPTFGEHTAQIKSQLWDAF